MDELIHTKVAPPRWMGDQIQRDLLLARLDGALHCRLTLIHAPAGYGKTSLLSQWRRRQDARIAWLTLGSDDADLRNLTRYIFLALDDAGGPGAARDDADRMSASLPARAAISAIINRLDRETGPVVLILDDFHRADGPEVDRFVSTLITLAPANCHFIVSSRDYPWLGQSVFAAEEQLLEFTAEDLKFSLSEAEELVARTLGADASDGVAGEGVRSVVARTEGWPIALQLASLSLKRGADYRQLVDQFRGPSPELARYLSEQVLTTLPEETREIVMRTSLFDRLTGDLVNMLCDRNDGWLVLDTIEEQGIFLTPLDTTRQAYRYHQLFAEHLRDLMMRRDMSQYRTLHGRAARWFAARGDVAEATTHAIEGDDDIDLAIILENAGGWRLIPHGQQTIVERGLAKLPGAVVDARPRLVLARVYLEIKRGELGTARADYDRYVTTLGESGLSADEWTEVRVVGDVLADYENEPYTLDKLLESEALLRALPANDHLVLANASETIAANYFEGGWLERALEPILAAREHYQAIGSLYSDLFTRFWELRIRSAQGRFKDASAILATARAEIDRSFGPRSDLAANCAAFEAALLYEQDKSSAATALLDWAVPHMEQSDGWVDVYAAGFLTAARILAKEGALDDALAMIARARRLAQRRRLRQLELLTMICELDILIDQDPIADSARARATQIDLDALASPSVGGRPNYRSVITAATLCRIRIRLIDGAYEAALAELRDLRHWAKQHGAARLLIDINLLLTHALHQTGDAVQARACFDDAVGSAMFQGIVRPFIDKQLLIEPVLNEALSGTVQIDRVRSQFLNSIARPLSLQTANGKVPRLLNDAESEILHHLSFGYSNKEIARLIGMSPDTVKYRLKSVFRKIGVNKRGDAARVVRERGLIEDRAL